MSIYLYLLSSILVFKLMYTTITYFKCREFLAQWFYTDISFLCLCALLLVLHMETNKPQKLQPSVQPNANPSFYVVGLIDKKTHSFSF